MPISFLPPPLENATYSLGIYEAKSGKLVRCLQEIAPESAFTVGLNGLITSWDGKDDAGKPVSPGHYAARGYAVGALKVEGKQILGNDWTNDDESLRIHHVQAITVAPADNGLALVALTSGSNEQVVRYGGTKNEFLWQKVAASLFPTTDSGMRNCSLAVQGDLLLVNVMHLKAAFRLADGSELTPPPAPPASSDTATSSAGKDGTVWKIESRMLCQYSPQGERLRTLTPKDGDPIPTAVAASKNADQLYLLEQTDSGDWQRIRGLAWKETTHEGEKAISTWETFFERSIHPLFTPGGNEKAAASGTDQTLVENPLSPGKTTHLKLGASYDNKGSYLTTADGLRLRQISQRVFLHAVKLVKAKTANRLTFYQSDGAAWDEFSIESSKDMMEFDAGEFEMTADGEKAHTGKNAEPPDL